eukprot:gene8211-8881_t
MTDPDPNQHLQRYFKLQPGDLVVLENLIAENLSGLFSFLRNQTATIYNSNERCHELFPDEGVLKRLMKYEKVPPASLSMCQDISTDPLLLTLAESGGFDEKTVDALLYLISKLDRNLRENNFEFVSFSEDHYIDDSCHYWNTFEEDEEVSLPTPSSNRKSKSLSSNGFYVEEESDRQRSKRRHSSSTVHDNSSTSSSSTARSVSTGSRETCSFVGSDDGVEESKETDDSDPIKLLLTYWPEISKYCASFSQNQIQSQISSGLNGPLVVKYEENFRPRRATSDLCAVMFPKKAEELRQTPANDFSTYRLEEEIEDEVALAASFVRTGFQANSSLQVLRSWSELLSRCHSHNYDFVAEQFFADSLRQKRKRGIAAVLTSSSSSSSSSSGPLVKRLRQLQQSHHINSFSGSADSPIPVACHHPAAWKIGPRPSLLDARASSGLKDPFECLHPAFIAIPAPAIPEKEEEKDEDVTKHTVSENPLHLLQLTLERLEHHLERFEARNIARLTHVYAQCSQEILLDAALATSTRLSAAHDITGSVMTRLQDSCIRLLRHNEPKQSGRVIYPKRPMSALPCFDSTAKSVGKVNEVISDVSSRQRTLTQRHSVTSLSLQQTLALPKACENGARDGSKRSFAVVSSENDEGESQSPRKRRVLSAVPLPPLTANSTTTNFVGGVCDTRHFPRNYDSFLSNLKPGDMITVRMKSKDPHRRFSTDKARKRRAVVLQLKKDVDCLRYVKVKLLSSEASEQRKSSASASSVSSLKASMQIHAKAVLWIAVEDGCLEPLHSPALPVSTSREVPLARREVLQLQSRANDADSVLEAVSSKEPDRPQLFLHEQQLVHPRHFLHSQPHSRLHPHSHSSLLPIPQIFLPTPPFDVQTPHMSHLSHLPPAFPFIHLPQPTKSPQFPQFPSSHPLHFAALSSQMPHSQSVRAPFPLKYLPPQTQRTQAINIEQELPTQHHPQSLLAPVALPSPRPPPLIYLTQEIRNSSPYEQHHFLHRHSSAHPVPLYNYNDNNITNNKDNNNNADNTDNNNNNNNINNNIKNNDNNHSNKEDWSHTNGHKYYNNPTYPFTTSANNHINCDHQSINVPQNGQANLVQGNGAMTIPRTHPMLQIRNPAILQQQLQQSNYLLPNLQRVIPTFPAPHQSIPIPSPNLQTFRLLPGGQLRKNNSSLNPKIL